MNQRLFPDVNIIRNGIKELKSLDLSSISFDDLDKKVMAHFEAIPCSYGSIDVGSKLFRARLNKKKTQRYEYYSDLLAPPSSLIFEFGRANRPHESVFYTATNLQLAAYEVLNKNIRNSNRQYLDEVLTIGIWEVKERLRVANIIHHPFLITSRPSSSLGNQYIDTVLEANMLPEDIESDKEICKFFSEEFIKEDIKNSESYKYSALYSYYIEHKHREFYDGINYPSVACKYSGDNQAIFLRSAKDKLIFFGCVEILCRVYKSHVDKFHFVVLSENKEVFNGKIVWDDFNYKKRNIKNFKNFILDNDLIDMYTVIR